MGMAAGNANTTSAGTATGAEGRPAPGAPRSERKRLSGAWSRMKKSDRTVAFLYWGGALAKSGNPRVRLDAQVAPASRQAMNRCNKECQRYGDASTGIARWPT